MEARVPFLDRSAVRLAMRLPVGAARGQEKWTFGGPLPICWSVRRGRTRCRSYAHRSGHVAAGGRAVSRLTGPRVDSDTVSGPTVEGSCSPSEISPGSAGSRCGCCGTTTASVCSGRSPSTHVAGTGTTQPTNCAGSTG
ncbi:hypothetical protein [Salinispora arenicola]|uniref:hypothetical protein n=1 Tax=Salinispora arenicola TaxID=168697 RepID=UPI003D160343